MAFYEGVRAFFEMLYFIAGIVMIITLFLGLKQLKVLKEDIEIRNKRAAVEKSLEYMDDFSKSIIPKMNVILRAYDMDDVPHKGIRINNLFFLEDSQHTNEVKQFIEEVLELGALDILNRLELFSAAIINGLADEKTLFKPTVKSYTSIVVFLYPVICNYRNDDKNGFTNIMELFLAWNGKLKKEDMEFVRKHLEQNIAEIPDVEIKSIGVK